MDINPRPFDVYSADERERHRYQLGTMGASPLLVVGLNPSVADRFPQISPSPRFEEW